MRIHDTFPIHVPTEPSGSAMNNVSRNMLMVGLIDGIRLDMDLRYAMLLQNPHLKLDVDESLQILPQS